MVQMVRKGEETGDLPNSSDFMREFEVSRRTVARDLDFLRDPPSPEATAWQARNAPRWPTTTPGTGSA